MRNLDKQSGGRIEANPLPPANHVTLTMRVDQDNETVELSMVQPAVKHAVRIAKVRATIDDFVHEVRGVEIMRQLRMDILGGGS